MSVQHLDYNTNTYLTVHLPPSSSYLANPHSLGSIHPALTHVGPVGVMKDVQIVSVPKGEWERISSDVLASLSGTDGIQNVEVQADPRLRAKRGTDEL